MKFALQALFQTFFLEVSRGSFLCERAARFEVDIHKEQRATKKWCSCGAAVQRERCVRCWRSAAIGKVHVTGTVRVHVTGMVRMHTGNTATHPRQCGTNGTPVRAKGSTPPICTNICTNATPVRRQNNAEAGSAVTCAAMAAV